MLPLFSFILIGFGVVIITIGSLRFFSIYKKSRLIECTFCGEVMDKSKFEIHKKTHVSEPPESVKELRFKVWLKDYLDTHTEITFSKDRIIELASKELDQSPDKIKFYITKLELYKPETKEDQK